MELIATTAFGLEAVVRRELTALGYEARVIQPGRLLFEGDAADICRANLWLRSAERILIRLGSFDATDFGQLFDGTSALPWEEWLTADAEFPVRGKSRKSQLSSVPACQKIVKKAIVERLRKAHQCEMLPETGPTGAIEIALLDDVATLSLDTTGIGLHKRGYRYWVGEAPLRETMAAALVQLSFWRAGRPLIDPFCGSGTILIEAALLGRNMAPGLNRLFDSSDWSTLDSKHWETAREEAHDLILPELSERVIGYDISEEQLKLARKHAEQAGVTNDIHWQQRPFAELLSKREYGCLITNPPYGERLGEDREIEALHREMPTILRRLPTWSHFILTAREKFEELIGQKANRRRKLFNGQIECTYYQFHGPQPPRKGQTQSTESESKTESESEPTLDANAPQQPVAVPRVFGGLLPESKRQAEEFANRLKKRAHHLRRWPTRRGITCYRLYERDVPDVPLVVDRYADALHIAEFDRPHSRTVAQHADWLDLMARTAAEVLGVERSNVFLKQRSRQRGTIQYDRVAEKNAKFVVDEADLKFSVNLSDYLDTGLFLDHRITRGMVRDAAQDKRFLNLFAYTGSFSVYAAAGGATSTTSVDLSSTYLDWAKENLQLNGFDGVQHQTVRADVMEFLENLKSTQQWDLAVVDVPTFSNSKRTDDDWEVQTDHVRLLNTLAQHLSPEGIVFFSTNYRRFKLDESQIEGFAIRDISKKTVPEDFRNQRIHRCWRMVREG